jgi:hypothetical protein
MDVLYAGASAWLGWSTGSREEIWLALCSAYAFVPGSGSRWNDSRFAHGFSFRVEFFQDRESVDIGRSALPTEHFFPRKGMSGLISYMMARRC